MNDITNIGVLCAVVWAMYGFTKMLKSAGENPEKTTNVLNYLSRLWKK